MNKIKKESKKNL